MFSGFRPFWEFFCFLSLVVANFHGWRRVWGEPGENRGEPGAPKRTGGEPGAFWEESRRRTGGFGIHLQRVPGENRGRTGGGGGNFP